MSNLSFGDKKFLEKVLEMHSGYVLDFSNASFSDFFNDFNINIYAPKYETLGTSKANRMRTFWKLDDNQTVGMVIKGLSKLIKDEKDKTKMEKIAESLAIVSSGNQAISENILQISICPEIHNHVRRYLGTGDYFHALEEAYKVVRKKLKQLTNQEKATNAFAEANFPLIFGHLPADATEKNFFEGTKFLNMAIQCFRNEKAHDLAKSLDKNVAIHYLALASLAYDLITRNERGE